MNMFCEDKVPDNEQDDEDAGMLELKALVEDKMAEEAKFEEELIKRTKAEFASKSSDAEARAAILKHLDDLAEAHLKKLNETATESLEKQMEEKRKMCDDFIQKLFGDINLKKYLKKWDDIIGNEKTFSTSAGPSKDSKPKTTRAGDAHVDADSDSIYAQFMNKSLPKPLPVKPEDKKAELEKIIRKIAVQHLESYVKSKSIDKNIYNIAVAHTIQHYLKFKRKCLHMRVC